MTVKERWLELATSDGERVAVRVVDVARARHLRLSLGRDGPRLSKPRWLPLREAVAFLHARRDWLEACLREQRQRVSRVRLPPLETGASGELPLRGEAVPIHVEAGPRPLLALEGGRLRLQWPMHRPPCGRLRAGLLRTFLDGQMRADVATLLADYTPGLGRAPTRLAVRPLRSLWGSLSARDHLSLDLALILAPARLLEYVVVHELSHLFERNHGPRFWARVAALLPDYRERQRQLHADGESLKADLAILLDPGAGTA